jgi:uncharacterized protein DUF3455
MKRIYLFSAALLAAGCSSTSVTNPPGDAGAPDGTVGDANVSDAPTSDAPTEAAASDAAPDAGDAASDAADAGDAGSSDATPDVAVGDGACPAPALPSDDPFTLDSGATTVVLHAAAAGVQDYTCEATAIDGGTAYVWTFVGPEADLDNCNSLVIAQHFASEAGAAFPEWQAIDGTYVIGQKSQSYTPDGGSGSVPWLVLNAVSTGGPDAGLFTGTQVIERLHTDGGIAPSADSCNADAGTVTQKVPYTADYYFLAP